MLNSEIINDATILVTGGTGSFGQEFHKKDTCRTQAQKSHRIFQR